MLQKKALKKHKDITYEYHQSQVGHDSWYTVTKCQIITQTKSYYTAGLAQINNQQEMLLFSFVDQSVSTRNMFK